MASNDNTTNQAIQLLPKLDVDHVPSLKQQNDTSRQSLSQTICLELLSQGHVRSFIDFFYMVLGHDKLQIAYTPESLNEFKNLLTQVEDSQAQGDLISIYDSRKKIAKYFESLQLYDVAISYFTQSLDISLKIMNTHPLIEMEATLNLGHAHELGGNLQLALENYERSKSIAHNRNNDQGEQAASKALIHVHISIADSLESQNKYNDAIAHYSQCILILEKESDEKSISDIEFRLGKAYKEIENVPIAIKYLEKFLSRCQKEGNRKGEGLALAALAECYEISGNIQLATSYLQSIVEMTETDPNQKLSEAHACNQLGILYNKMKQYPLAVRYFERHYKLAVELGLNQEPNSSDKRPESTFILRSEHIDTPDIGVAAVQLGIARGNAQMPKFFSIVTEPRKLGQLLLWKAKRLDRQVKAN